jgi:hypothetical protein
MASQSSSIKIIKRNQRESLATRKERPTSRAQTENKLRREIVKTITYWIGEQRKANLKLATRATASSRLWEELPIL